MSKERVCLYFRQAQAMIAIQHLDSEMTESSAQLNQLQASKVVLFTVFVWVLESLTMEFPFIGYSTD